MKQITCQHCGDIYPDFDVAHVCSKGPYAPKFKPKMNERIREIAKQAYIADASKLPNWKFKPETELLLKQLGGFNEKFAELIVRECLSVIEEMNPHDPERNIDDIFDEIEEHFGIQQ